MRTLVSLLALISGPVWAWTFAEGYSSPTPGAAARIFYREFTIYTGQEACARSPVPASISLRLDSSALKVGARIHRHERSELIVEAYDGGGRFLASVPIAVEVLADPAVLKSRADWDYLEAIGPGDAQLVVTWACEGASRIDASLRVAVTAA